MTDDKTPSPAGTNDEATQAEDTPTATEAEAAVGQTGDVPAASGDPRTGAQDVRSRIQSRVSATRGAAAGRARSVRERMTGDEGKPTPLALGVVGGVLAAAAAILARLSLRRPSKRSKRRR